MSDADLRELECRFRETGRVEDELAWLSLRLRLRQVELEDVQLAALGGHTPACQLIGADPSSALPMRQRLRALGTPAVQARAAIALLRERVQPKDSVVRRVSSFLMSALVSGGPARLHGPRRDAVEALEAWIVCPCQLCAAHSTTAGLAALADAEDLAASLDDWRAPDSMADMNHRHLSIRYSIACGQAALLPGGGGLGRLLESLEDFLGHEWEQASGLLALEFVPWALGYGDPVRCRVEARHREAARE